MLVCGMDSCSPCAHYHNGQGSKPCLSCPHVQNKAIFENSELPRQGVLAHTARLDKEHLENLLSPSPYALRGIYKILPHIDLRSATMLLQNKILKMTQTEIAEMWSLSQTQVSRLIQQALREVREKGKGV